MQNVLRTELAAIKLACYDVDYLRALSPDLFLNEETRDLFVIISKEYIKNKVLPSPVTIEALVREHGLTDKLNGLLESFEKLEVKKEEFPKIFKTLVENKQLYAIKTALEAGADLLKKKNVTQAVALFQKTIEEIKTHRQKENEIFFSMGGDFEAKVPASELFKPEAKIPTMFEELDRKLNGGFGKDHLISLVAPKGSGKSALSLVLGLNAYRQGYNVVYYSLEMSKKDWLERYLTAISGISNKKIQNQDLTPEEQLTLCFSLIKEMYVPEAHDKLLHIFEKNKRKFIGKDLFKVAELFKKKVLTDYLRDNYYGLMDVAGRPIVTDLEITLERIKATKGLDMVIIDYINFLRYHNEKLPLWEKLNNIAVTLKDIAKNLQCTVVVLAQLEAREQDTRYSRGITESCDLALAWELKDEIDEGQIKIFDMYSIKARFGASVRNLEMVANIDLMDFQIKRSLGV